MTTIAGIDLAAAKAQMAKIQQQAQAAVDERIQTAAQALKEVQQLVDSTGCDVNVYNLKSIIDDLQYNNGWNSSSC